MIYLTENIIIPIVNPIIGNRIKFVNQVTKETAGSSLSVDGNFYSIDFIPVVTGLFDYFIYSTEDENNILLSGIASSLNEREHTSYSATTNIKAYNG